MVAAYKDENYTSYIGAAYVKYVEMAGARVVPVLIDQPDEYYRMIFNKTNGLLIPGGAANILNSGKHNHTFGSKVLTRKKETTNTYVFTNSIGYQRAAQKIWEIALEEFDTRGDYYPIWSEHLNICHHVSFVTGKKFLLTQAHVWGSS